MRQSVIYWLKPDEGGRKTLPTSTTYYGTTNMDNKLSEFWSVVIQFDKPLKINEYISPCKVSFLVDNAPNYILDEITEFVIYEGPKKVARIIFVDVLDDIPPLT